MTHDSTVVFDPAELDRLLSAPILRSPRVGTIRLCGTMAAHPSRERWEREIAQALHACGCDTGAKGVLITFVAGAACAAGLLAAGTPWWAATGSWLGAAVAGGLVGKLVGIGRARARLRETIHEIWADPRTRPGDHPAGSPGEERARQR